MENMTSRNNLERKLGLFPTTNIVVANMIGAGIFTTSGLLMADLGSPILMITLWIVGGFIAICGALCYGELGAAIPRAGGEYIFLSKLYNPLVGFLSGWVSFIVGFSAPIAASAIGFSVYFVNAFPEVGTAIGVSNPLIIKKSLSIIVLIGFTFIHIRGIEFGTIIQNYLTVLKIGLIVGLIILGFSFGQGDFGHFKLDSSFSFNFSGWKTMGLSLMWIMFAYSGWNASTYIGSEIKKPAKNLPRSLLLGTGIVMLLYFLLNIFYIYAVPPENMKGVLSIGGLAAKNMFGKSIGRIFSLFIAFALFSSLSAFIILGPRVYYSMAKDGYFFKFVAKIHPIYKTPSKAIMLQCLIAVVIVLSSSFDQILTYMGFSLGIFPILAILGVLKLRRSGKSTFKFPGYFIAPFIYIFAGAAMMILSFFERPVESSIALFTVIAGIPAYLFFRKNNFKSF